MSQEKIATRLKFHTRSASETRRVGARLGELVQAGDLICLEGDLGAGKTCFVQGLGQGLGIRDAIHSPTFILANEHRGGRLPLYHLDVYRVRSARETIGFGLDDYLSSDGVLIIEWAEKIREALPLERLWISFAHLREIPDQDEDARSISLHAAGQRYEALVSALWARPPLPFVSAV